MARKTLLEAQTDARQAMEKLTENKAECSREHHTITTETEAVQEELRKTTERNLQNQEVQVAKTDAMGCRLAEITDLLDQWESRMETQMRDMCAQIQKMNATLLNTKPTADRSRSTFDNLLRDTEVALSRARDFTPKPRECIPIVIVSKTGHSLLARNIKKALNGVNRCFPALFKSFFGRMSECWRQCEPDSDEIHNEQKRVSATSPSHSSRRRPTALKFDGILTQVLTFLTNPSVYFYSTWARRYNGKKRRLAKLGYV